MRHDPWRINWRSFLQCHESQGPGSRLPGPGLGGCGERRSGGNGGPRGFRAGGEFIGQWMVKQLKQQLKQHVNYLVILNVGVRFSMAMMVDVGHGKTSWLPLVNEGLMNGSQWWLMRIHGGCENAKVGSHQRNIAVYCWSIGVNKNGLSGVTTGTEWLLDSNGSLDLRSSSARLDLLASEHNFEAHLELV